MAIIISGRMGLKLMHQDRNKHQEICNSLVMGTLLYQCTLNGVYKGTDAPERTPCFYATTGEELLTNDLLEAFG